MPLNYEESSRVVTFFLSGIMNGFRLKKFDGFLFRGLNFVLNLDV